MTLLSTVLCSDWHGQGSCRCRFSSKGWGTAWSIEIDFCTKCCSCINIWYASGQIRCRLIYSSPISKVFMTLPHNLHLSLSFISVVCAYSFSLNDGADEGQMPWDHEVQPTWVYYYTACNLSRKPCLDVVNLVFSISLFVYWIFVSIVSFAGFWNKPTIPAWFFWFLLVIFVMGVWILSLQSVWMGRKTKMIFLESKTSSSPVKTCFHFSPYLIENFVISIEF